MDLTAEQWYLVKPHIPQPPCRPGRPRRDERQVLNGILWVLRTGAPWRALPDCYPSYQTCHRRFQNWTRSGVMKTILQALAQDLRHRGGLDLEHCLQKSVSSLSISGISDWKYLHNVLPRHSWQIQTAFIFITPAAKTTHQGLKPPAK